jgi:hypothetical protein
MALAFYFAPPNKMSAQQYDECIARLKAAGAEHPKGRLYHSCFGTPDNLMVFDVWTSQTEFEAFGPTLIPILESLGVGPATPQVMALHNTVVPPSPKAKAAAKKKPAKKKAAPKKAKAKATPRKKAKKR